MMGLGHSETQACLEEARWRPIALIQYEEWTEPSSSPVCGSAASRRRSLVLARLQCGRVVQARGGLHYLLALLRVRRKQNLLNHLGDLERALGWGV